MSRTIALVVGITEVFDGKELVALCGDEEPLVFDVSHDEIVTLMHASRDDCTETFHAKFLNIIRELAGVDGAAWQHRVGFIGIYRTWLNNSALLDALHACFLDAGIYGIGSPECEATDLQVIIEPVRCGTCRGIMRGAGKDRKVYICPGCGSIGDGAAA